MLVLLGSVAGQFGRKKMQPGGGAAAMMRDELEAEAELRTTTQPAGGVARDFEMENMARHKAGELNTAELGLENMKAAMRDPSVMTEMAEMMKDPENQRQLKEMMADPSFQAQARQAMQQMGAAGMPDLSKMMNDPQVMAKAQAMAQAMYGGGAPGGGAAAAMGAGGGQAAELARLRAENARLQQMAV